MNKGVYQDSLRSCDLYSNPYDTRMQSHPALVKQRQQNYLKAQDTLASAQTKMEKEILMKILEGSFSLPKGKFMLIARLGKYALLALVLPPYIFCYGMPKWLLTEGLPKLYNMVQKLFRRISTKVTDKVTDVAHNTVAALSTFGKKITSPILTFIKTRLDKARELFNHTQRKVQDVFAYPFRLINKKVIRPFTKLISHLGSKVEKAIQTYHTVKAKLSELRHEIRQFFIYLPNNIRDKSVELFNRLLANGTSLLPLAWAKNVAATFKRRVDAFNQRAGALLDRFLFKPSRTLRNAAQSLARRGKIYINSITRPVVQWAEPKIEAAQKTWDSVLKRINSHKERIKDKAEENWKALADRTDSAVKSATQSLAAAVQSIPQLIPQPVLSLFTPLASFVSEPFNYRKTKGVLKAFMKKVRDKVDAGLQRSAKWLLKAGKAAKKVAESVYERLKTLPLKLLSLLKKILLFIATALKGAFLIVRLMLAWMKALIRYAVLLAADVTRELLKSST